MPETGMLNSIFYKIEALKFIHICIIIQLLKCTVMLIALKSKDTWLL